eukprot:1126708-Rhodomonas_salina.2
MEITCEQPAITYARAMRTPLSPYARAMKSPLAAYARAMRTPLSVYERAMRSPLPAYAQNCASCLCACYAMSGTDVACGVRTGRVGAQDRWERGEGA